MLGDEQQQADSMLDNGVNSVGGGGIGSVNNNGDYSILNDINPNSVQNHGGPFSELDHHRNAATSNGDFDHHAAQLRFYQEDFFDSCNSALAAGGGLGGDEEEDFYDQYERQTKSGGGGGVDGSVLNGVWLVAPLIQRLPYTCQIKVLDNACK
jgi:hypothetical protein